MKKFAYLITSVIMIATSATPAFALDRPFPLSSTSATREGMKATITQDRVGSLQERAGKEISNRISHLQALLNRLNEIKRLSSDQKTQFTSQIQLEITTLQTLQTKIQGDTDPQTLKTDVQSIVTDYRVYALFIPKISIFAASDRVLNTAEQMSSVVTALQTRITEEQGKGKDVSNLQTLLTDMQAKIADAKTQAKNATNTVLPLTPDGYPGNKSTLELARTMLVSARKDLETAWQDGREIIQGLRVFGRKITNKKNDLTSTSSSSAQ